VGILWTVIVGFLVGLVARAVLPGNQAIGLIMTTLLGIGGALLAGFAGQALGWYKLGEPVGFIGAVVGALLLLVIWGRVTKR
jgi:uncharacterized membrane protein YeaQ/YmgE (transglycosylase-associated protein family)